MTDVPVSIGAYRLESQIGAGAMGTVYLATDTRLDRRVAVKLLYPHLGTDPGYLSRFAHEATVLARLDSSHVIPIYDHGQYEGRPYLVTQYAAGGDLGALLRTRGPMPAALALELAGQVADGLAAAHAVGVIHRDVKPGNVLLRDPDLSRPHAYLADFGVAFTEASGLTAPGSITGTRSYLAPERTHGHPGSPASDVYAAGCVLHEMLTGRPPYAGNDVEVAMAHLDAPVPQLPGRDRLTHGINRVLARSMAKDPAARYPSAAELRDDLRAVLSGAPTMPGAGPAPLAGRVGPAPSQRHRGLVAVAAVAALVVVGGGVAAYILARGGGSTPVADPTSSASGSGTATTDHLPHAVTGDLTGNGKGDLALVSDGARNLFASTGTTFSAVTHPSYLGNDDTVGAAECDTDADGHEDVVTYGVSPTVRVAAVTGATTHTIRFPTSIDYASGGACADFNGDGRDDVALWSVNEPETVLTFDVALSEPGGGFGTPQTWMTFRDGGSKYLNLTRMATGDFDGDGKADVAVFSRDNDSFVLYRSNGARMVRSGGRIDADAITGTEAFDSDPVVAADLYGDGKTELVVVHFDGGIGVLRLSDGSWQPAAGYQASSRTENADLMFATASDVNGDGRDDIVGAGVDGKPWVYLGGAAGLNAPGVWNASNKGKDWRGLVSNTFNDD